MTSSPQRPTDPALPANTVLIEVRVPELRRLFDPFDPSPFRNQDLDPKVEEFIVGWSRDAHRDAPLALLVHVDGPASPGGNEVAVGDAVKEAFRQRSDRDRRRLKELFGRGRTSLGIGLGFLAATVATSDLLASAADGASNLREVLRQGFAIVGWVAMWRPLEIFLYDWWPIVADLRRSRRLAAMPVRIRFRSGEAGETPPASRAS